MLYIISLNKKNHLFIQVLVSIDRISNMSCLVGKNVEIEELFGYYEEKSYLNDTN
jgi:hypothetical protein